MRLLRQLMTRQGCTARVIMTDNLRGYGAAVRTTMPRLRTH
ncbi:hypothetical protein LX81_04175 [Palleronia aestuarii]|uniref:Uncharacterized protein n=1 Tax=Palleronia aestuarii TaxID=568105 RepID=A0A2W7MSV4_9RHOB|nr:hypothetical protein LX81_04175 [Palleronia aestuarii]